MMNQSNEFRSLGAFARAVAGVVVAVGLATSPAWGQEPTPAHLTAARSVISATEATADLDQILPATMAALMATLIQNRPDIEAQITEIVTDAALELAPRRGDLENEVAQIYARMFTIEELNAIAAFFSTEAGQKFLNEAPTAIGEIDAAAQVWTTGIRRDLTASVRAKLQEAGLE